MLSLRKLRYIFLASVLAILAGCDEENPPAARVKMGTDQEYLKNKIKIPKPADRVKYEIRALGMESFLPGPTDYRLTALLYYSADDFAELTKSSRKKLVKPKQKILDKARSRPHGKRYFTTNVPDWFKDEEALKGHIEGGRLRLEHFLRLDPENYHRSPYLHGKVIALDEQRALLVILYTM